MGEFVEFRYLDFNVYSNFLLHIYSFKDGLGSHFRSLFWEGCIRNTVSFEPSFVELFETNPSYFVIFVLLDVHCSFYGHNLILNNFIYNSRCTQFIRSLKSYIAFSPSWPIKWNLQINLVKTLIWVSLICDVKRKQCTTRNVPYTL